MAYTLKVEGLEELSKMLTAMGDRAPGIAAQAVYTGAGIMRDAIERDAKAIRTAPFRYAGPGEERLPSPEEKDIVMRAGAGIAKFDKNGTEVQTSVGYSNSGYDMLNGKRKPIPVIVNAINSGTSFMRKQAFVRNAARKAKDRTERAMTEVIETAFEAIINGKTED